ncbi:MAG: dicarboxylate/amino acid:cation symporter [bacterium]|nr:dicarboxylate/amino acid:cation symporter [bacterium]
MKKRAIPILLFLALALYLSFESVRDDGTFRGVGPMMLNAAILFATMIVFLLVLRKRYSIPIQIFIAMVAGIGAGWALAAVGETAFVTDYLNIFGSLFVRLLKLVITPLIFVSIVCGVAGIGDVRKLGSLGAKSLLFYFGTTAVAVIIGLVCVNVIRPGSGREELIEQAETQAEAAKKEEQHSLGMRIQTQMMPKIIQNPVMAGQSPLVIIFFAIILGAALAALDKQTAQPALHVFQALDKAFITIVLWIMVLAPIGVFTLMAKAIATLGIEYVVTLAKYCFTVVFGLGLHFVFLSFVLVSVVGRISPLRFLKGMAPAFQVSFSTSSSSATLPVTIECAHKRVGADENVCNFMLPIGATINMDGTALYTSVASLFIAQVYGIDLSLQQQFMVFLTAILVSVGTAGIPGASIALMTIILDSVGLPIEGIGIIIGLDRFLDMCRTMVNITGDSVGTVVVSQSEGVMHPAPLE